MIKKILYAFTTLTGLLSSTVAAEQVDKATVLTDSTFDDHFKKHSPFFVMFYSHEW
jgi:hypothetical protein